MCTLVDYPEHSGSDRNAKSDNPCAPISISDRESTKFEFCMKPYQLNRLVAGSTHSGTQKIRKFKRQAHSAVEKENGKLDGKTDGPCARLASDVVTNTRS